MRVYDLKDLDSMEVPQQPVQPPKKKGRVWLWVLTVVLLAALIAEPFVILALQQTNSIAGAQINGKGELLLQYTNGKTENLGVVVGQDGKDGQDGSDGKDGIPGTGGSQGGSDVTGATAVGLRSAVSIYCTFTQEGRFGQTTQYYSAGSGVIYRMNKEKGDAFIITNYHVVFDAASRTQNGIAEVIECYLYGGQIEGMEIKATYVGGSQNYDIAVLRVENSQVLKDSAACAATVANSDEVRVGSTAIAIGNPEGDGISASLGVVSVDSEHITMNSADGFSSVDFRVMRVDTAVNSGNSGGGLFDGQGRLIGIVNAKIMDEQVENIGYALPSTTVTAVADNIIDFCYGTACETVMRPIMGVTVLTTGSSGVYDEQTGSMTIRETVEIYQVTPGQIGELFQVGDVLVSVKLGDVMLSITRQHQIIDLMLTARPGDVAVFTVLREGAEKTLEVTVTEDCLTAY